MNTHLDHHVDRRSEEVGHEVTDVHVRPIAWLAGAVAVVTVIAALVLWGLLAMFKARAASNDPDSSPLAVSPPEPPEPRLQSSPNLDYRVFRDQEEKALNEYGWVDQDRGIVRIPVSRAMDLLLERGIPEPVGEEKSEESQQREPKRDSTNAASEPDSKPAEAANPEKPPVDKPAAEDPKPEATEAGAKPADPPAAAESAEREPIRAESDEVPRGDDSEL